MNRTHTITLELLEAGDGLSGRALPEEGAAREFNGRLGLMRTIDELLAAPSRSQEAEMNPTATTTDPTVLRRLIGGPAYGPGEEGYDAARGTFNLTIDQRPALIAEPGSREEVAALVRFAAAEGLRVAPQRTGHNAGPLGPLDGTLLLKTNRLGRVHIDAAAHRARVGAGARWEDVVPPASELGLAALHGSTPDVSVAGYSLGGGMGWYARKHGLAANSIRAIELVTADGEIRRVDHDNEPELFWALRGGGGNYGVVTALEFDLLPVSEVFAGTLFFPFERTAEVLQAWHEWTAGVPDEVTSVGRMLQFPPVPEVPEPVRGKSFAVVEAVFLGSEAEGREIEGTQTSIYDRTIEAADECSISDHSFGREKVTFHTTKPIYVTATHMPGEFNPQMFAARQLGIPTTAKVQRSFTPAITGPANECEDNGGGAEETKPDCGTRTVRPWKLNLQYATEKKNALLLSGTGDDDPYVNCPSNGIAAFPWLLVEQSGHAGKYIYAEVSQDELFDPKFQKWIAIGTGSSKDVGTGWWSKTDLTYSVSFTRLKR